ncbi:MAG: hypothetical protein JWQ96_1176 [Segetibacter sp.]|nr:hypothetical protein [Segetibacter sp.]
MKSFLNMLKLPLFLITMVTLMVGCKYDIKDIGPKAKASFTVTPISGQVNRYLLSSTSQNTFMYEWNKADGKGYVSGKAIDTAYFPDKGTYIIKILAYGPGGIDSTSQTVTVAADDPAAYNPYKLLTTRSWKLDPGATANAVVVGTESSPTQYYGGGPLVDCQKDDVYTFGADNKLTYRSNGSTFNGGNVAPNFQCSGDRSYTGVNFTFSNTVPAGSAGIASITLSNTPPNTFIGVTDVSSNNYRIISITQTTMVLRSGTAAEAVHTMKFISQ